MASYRYKAQNSDGRVVSGRLNATDTDDLHNKLKANSMLLIEANEVKDSKRTSRRLKYDRVADFSRNLGKLLGAGVTLVRALGIISEDESTKENERRLYADCREAPGRAAGFGRR